MVRESKDHGPYNSWDRVPYITNLRYGRPSIVPADRQIHHNFVIANYNSEGAIDTDDGSAYYRTHHNFFAYGANGLKSDFGGHDNHHVRNIYAYVGGCFGAPMPWRYGALWRHLLGRLSRSSLPSFPRVLTMPKRRESTCPFTSIVRTSLVLHGVLILVIRCPMSHGLQGTSGA